LLSLPRKQSLIGYVLILPALLIMSLLLLYPFFYATWLSFHTKMIGAPAIYVGIKNYLDVLASKDFYIGFLRSITYTFPAVFLKLILGSGLALILNQEFKGRRIMRSLAIIPWVLPVFVVAFIWMWMYDYALGALNIILRSLGLPVVRWLSIDSAMMSLIIVNVWKGFPFFFMGILSGLQSVPQDLLDAASVDGASTIQRFRYVTIPYILPVIYIVSLLSIIWTFGDFTTIWILTRGGPGDASLVLPVLIYQTLYAEFDAGKASALSILTMPFSIFFIYLIVRLLRR